MDAMNAVLARKLGLTPDTPEESVEDEPVTSTILMRRALSRAADKAVGLSSTVLEVSEEDLEAEDLIANGPAEWIVLGMRSSDSAGLSGLFMMDPVLRTALVEMQTMGSLLPPPEEQRKITRTDTVMCMPFADLFLSELDEVGFGGGKLNLRDFDLVIMPDLRTVGLVMVQGLYRMWRIKVQVSGSDAPGEILMATRQEVQVAPPESPTNLGWSKALRHAVEDAPTQLDAVLSKLSLPIEDVEAFEVGQLLSLAGTTVESISLYGPDGEEVATARLGQIAGKRAVRIESFEVELEQAPTPMAGGFTPEIEQDLPMMDDLPELPAMEDAIEPALDVPEIEGAGAEFDMGDPAPLDIAEISLDT